jgi:hypothetical protein
MIVYHGTVEVIKKPDVFHSFRPLDFGKGFYVTTEMKSISNMISFPEKWLMTRCSE